MNNRRRKSRRISDKVVSQYVTGLILLVVAVMAFSYFPIGLQQLISFWTETDSVSSPEAVMAKSFSFLIFASILVGGMLGRFYESFLEGHIRTTGFILGSNIGFFAFLLLASILTRNEVYQMCLLIHTTMFLAVFIASSNHRYFPLQPRATMVIG